MRSAAVLLVTAAAGCSAPPRTIDEATLQTRVAEHEHIALERRDRLAMRFLRRIELIHAEGRDGPVEMDVLLLSSGGQYGAFGAGVLAGWGDSRSPEHMRPTFDIVTGVSTGALIAPFALAGTDQSIRRVSELFKQADDSLATLRGLLFFLPWRTSMFDTRVLRERIQSEVDSDAIAEVIEAHAEHRMLLIGATDLDLGRFHIWDMGPIAIEAQRSGDISPFHNALISSSSIPGAFPPIEIDGVLYTDGAVAMATFLGLDRDLVRQVVSAFKERNPGAATPRLRMWMIVNGHIDPPKQLAEQGWTSVAVRSAAVMLSYSLRSTLRIMQLGAELIGRDIGEPVEFRYIAVPEDVDLPEPVGRLFDQALMTSLYGLGYRLGNDPASWRTEVIAPDIPGSTIVPRDVPFHLLDDAPD